MFEVAELGRKVDKEEFKQQEPALREALLDIQFRLQQSRDVSYVILMSGVEAAGKGSCVNLLLEWMDARLVDTYALGDPSAQEEGLPYFHRFWSRLPPRGRGAIFLGNWYTQPIIESALGNWDEARVEKTLQRIVQFERMLAQEGVVLLKFWLHLSKKEQRKRLEAMADDPAQSWRLTQRDWHFHENYDRFVEVCDRALRRTSTGLAPWTVVEATQPRYRDLTVARHIQETLNRRMEEVSAAEPAPSQHLLGPPEPVNILRSMDLSQRFEDEQEYKRQRRLYQSHLGRLSRVLQEQQRSVVLVFEGMDAAGKGGAIRRITHALDARFYQVVSVAAPTEEERSRPYLWRFWRRVPQPGHFTVFDRSWYGRVLVERVEGFCATEDWQRAYNEINHFEEQLQDAGAIVIKFWLQISDEEQRRRFEAREQTGYKRHKLTDEDWRNREKWPLYEGAICDMIARTSTTRAPWHLIEAEQKHFARVKVLRTVCETIAEALDVDVEELLQEDVRRWEEKRQERGGKPRKNKGKKDQG